MWFGILGPLTIRNEEGTELRLRGALLPQVLAVLLCSPNRPVAAGRLIEIVWEGRPPRSARTNLQVYVHRLRRVVGEDRIEHRAGAYSLLVAPEELDATVFEARAADAFKAARANDAAKTAHLGREALALWRGEAFGGSGSIDSVRKEADRLDSMRLSLFDETFRAELEIGRHTQLVPELSALVTEHPLHEGLRAKLMVALYRADRIPAALEVARTGRAIMAEELGLDPGPELRALEQAILDESPSLRLEANADNADIPSELPPAPTFFTGRDIEIQQVRDALSGPREQVAVVAIDGPGGAGKSALAIHVAQQLAGVFPDGRLYVNLRGATPGLTPLAPAEALGHLLRSLGVADSQVPADLGEAAARLRTLTAGKRILIVLDDAATVEQVRPLLPGSPSSAALITSRGMLATLGATDHLHLTALSDEETVTLLQNLVADDSTALTEVARLCGGLPLAARIIGARLAGSQDLTPAELAVRLSDEHRRLDELSHADMAIRASLAVSYAGLSPDSARAFALCSVLEVASLTAPVIAAVSECVNVDRAIDELLRAQLLQVLGPGRYGFHDLVRLYARESCPPEEEHAAIERGLHHYVASVRTLAAMDGRAPARLEIAVPPDALRTQGVALADLHEGIAWLDPEVDNIVLAAEQAVSIDKGAIAVALATAVCSEFQSRLRIEAAAHLAELSLRVAERAGEPSWQAYANNDLGVTSCYLPDRKPTSIPYLERAVELWREVGDPRGESMSLNQLGNALRNTDPERAETALWRAIELRRASNPRGLESLLGNYALAVRKNGRLDEAIAALEEAIEISRGDNDLHHEGIELGNLAETLRLAGRAAESVPVFERAIDLMVATHEKIGEAEFTWSLAVALDSLERPTEALAWRKRSLAIQHEVGEVTADEVAKILATENPEMPEAMRLRY